VSQNPASVTRKTLAPVIPAPKGLSDPKLLPTGVLLINTYFPSNEQTCSIFIFGKQNITKMTSTEKTVVITGATGQLGRQCVKAFEADGWNVVGTGMTTRSTA
jgi:hypothetical protein